MKESNNEEAVKCSVCDKHVPCDELYRNAAWLFTYRKNFCSIECCDRMFKECHEKASGSFNGSEDGEKC